MTVSPLNGHTTIEPTLVSEIARVITLDMSETEKARAIISLINGYLGIDLEREGLSNATDT